MTTGAQKKQQRLQRLNLKAWIGFLISYNLSNIYHIWVLAQNKVISTRDVIFNEDAVFSGNIEDLKDDLLHTTSMEFMELVKRLALPETRFLEDVLLETIVEDNIEFIVPIGLDTALDVELLLDLDSQCVPTPEQALDA